ncbi:MAG: cytochrome c biogenesis protein CcsA [bacterium]|nr:cytochrome c biogenesis protein CcsA [bacterium]
MRILTDHRLLHMLVWGVLLVAVGSLTSGCTARKPQAFEGELERSEPWSPELVAEASGLPVQDNGRVKPLSTFAAFLLYRVHGRRDMKFAIGEKAYKLSPTEWILDVWCHPDQAADYPLFRIENVGALDALGIENAGQSQNFVYVSYRDLLQKGQRLGELADQYMEIETARRNAVQEHIVQLWNQLNIYHQVHQQLAAMHHDFVVEGEELEQALGDKKVRLGRFVENAEPFRNLVRSVGKNTGDKRLGNAIALLTTLDQMQQSAGGVGLFPPADADDKTWMSVGGPVDQALRGKITSATRSAFLALQRVLVTADDAARLASLREYRTQVSAIAETRGETSKIEIEENYYLSAWHYRAMMFFIVGFLLAAICWLVPKSRIMWTSAFAVTAIGLVLLSYDIYLRCVITERPPIKNLYDTFLFIAASTVLVCLAVELIWRYRIALALAPLGGGLLVMLGRAFEQMDGKDTLDPLVAVLDSNYWLATHVTMINFGYGAAFVAGGLLAKAYLVLRVARVVQPKDQASRLLARFIYGVTCFSLLFTVVGTIYGGVWANDSWGRFWGWDPKENGALMICLSQIAMLHARFTGMIRDFGIAIWALVTWGIVVFSWMHTNLLGVGLHNYGFSSELRDAVWTNYCIIGGLVMIAAVDWLIRRDWSSATQRSEAEPPPLPSESAE